jgi:flavodoxin
MKKALFIALGLFMAMPQTFAKDLIVYLSRSHNTEAMAKMIQAETGGDLVALELVQPYPENYRATVEQVQRENESGYLPPLKTRIDDVAQYERIFIGFPTWGMQLPPPVKSFLNAQDFAGKEILPFNTHAGYGLGNSLADLQRYCRDCQIGKALSIEGGKERDGILFVMQGDKAAEILAQVRQWLIDIRP